MKGIGSDVTETKGGGHASVGGQAGCVMGTVLSPQIMAQPRNWLLAGVAAMRESLKPAGPSIVRNCTEMGHAG
jgi:hypothetical protein